MAIQRAACARISIARVERTAIVEGHAHAQTGEGQVTIEIKTQCARLPSAQLPVGRWPKPGDFTGEGARRLIVIGIGDLRRVQEGSFTTS
jgi:hypothetical protein